MALKSDGEALARRYREMMRALVGSMLEMQIPPKAITVLFEASLEEARDIWAKDHDKEITETVFAALLKKSI